jgi:hypothetical protein
MCHVTKQKNADTQSTSAFNVFHNREELEKVVRRLLSYRGQLDDLAVAEQCAFQGSGTGRIANFQPMVAAKLIREFIGVRSGRLFDPCGGWGGRLLGAYLSGVVSSYTCCEPSKRTHSGLRALAANIAGWDSPAVAATMATTIMYRGCETVSRPEIGEVDLVFTSPPYFNLERYSEEGTQSICRFPVFLDWVDGFLQPMLALSFACLKPGGVALINITNNQQLPELEQKTIEKAIFCGFTVLEKVHMLRPKSCNCVPRLHPPARAVTQPQGDEFSRSEMIYVFEKAADIA